MDLAELLVMHGNSQSCYAHLNAAGALDFFKADGASASGGAFSYCRYGSPSLKKYHLIICEAPSSVWSVGATLANCDTTCGALGKSCVEDRWPTTLAEFTEITSEIGFTIHGEADVSRI